jgi:DNA (cytosine-5)-methyltransferase 3A
MTTLAKRVRSKVAQTTTAATLVEACFKRTSRGFGPEIPWDQQSEFIDHVGIRVLSLFDGIGCAREALEQAGVKVSEYVAYEIDLKPRRALMHNHFDAKPFNDVLDMEPDHMTRGRFDLVVGGSPCQGFSLLGKQMAYDDPRSALYFEFERVVAQINPEYFLLENVRMAKHHENVINENFGRPHRICASEVSGISRPRNYWTNIRFGALEHVGLSPMDVIDFDNETPNTDSWHVWYARNRSKRLEKSYTREFGLGMDRGLNAICQTARQVANWNGNLVALPNGTYRHFTPMELEMMHGLPRGYTATMSKTQAYKALGNGWAVQVVKQIFEGLHE